MDTTWLYVSIFSEPVSLLRSLSAMPTDQLRGLGCQRGTRDGGGGRPAPVGGRRLVGSNCRTDVGVPEAGSVGSLRCRAEGVSRLLADGQTYLRSNRGYVRTLVPVSREARPAADSPPSGWGVSKSGPG